jgi:hypothetical protein
LGTSSVCKGGASHVEGEERMRWIIKVTHQDDRYALTRAIRIWRNKE